MICTVSFIKIYCLTDNMKKRVENLMVFEQREITPMKSENNLRTKIELFPFSLKICLPITT